MSSDYQIRVQGSLDASLASWFGNFAISHAANGDNTLLTGSAVDQAALLGAVARCRDLGLTLISVNPFSIEANSAEAE